MTKPTSSKTTPSPSATSTQAKATQKTWKTYRSPKWNWSINYPPSWYSLANFGAPDTDKYFATQRVSSPLGLSGSGLWLNVRTFSGDCQHEYTGKVVERASIIVDRQHTTYAVMGPGPDGEWAALVSVPSGVRCYNLGTLGYSRKILDQNAQLIRRIYQTFRS